MEYVGYVVPTLLCHMITRTFAGSIRKCLDPPKSQIGLSSFTSDIIASAKKP